ncbi:energy transducer TonB [Vibrio japonicus]|uniref:Energy transducer TonB n=1 Tax=Vibrio japonicus TaxID=1824638 RepID=A0ABY5LQE7_9VIBR|nr:energy transducer TonB [Vibrio japonicus]UUM33066.1 energy transducer TonB [Vibrio japonicus]
MNLKRYCVAGGVSLAVHAAFLFVAHEPKVFAMPTGNQSTSVSINFTTQPTPKAVETPPTEQPAEKPVTPPPVKEKVVKQEEPKPVKKKAKPVEKKKPVKKQEQPKVKPQKAVEQPKAKQVTQEKPAETHKPEPEKQATDPKPAVSNKGASAQPVLVQKPSFLTNPTPPNYPRLARKRGIEGVAVYEVWLDKNGKQVKQVLMNSSGTKILDKAALDAIKKWKFSPHTVDGVRMAHRVQIPIRFKLDR